MEAEIYQIGAVGVIFVFAIREFFLFLRAKRNSNGQNKLLDEVRLLNVNHLSSMKQTIKDGDTKIVETINTIGQKQIEILSRIEGKISK